MPVEVVQHGQHSLAGRREPVGDFLDITRKAASDPVHVQHPPRPSVGQAIVQFQRGNGEHEPYVVRDP